MLSPSSRARLSIPNESQEQSLYFRWLDVVTIQKGGQAPHRLRDHAYHVPNGGGRRRIEAAILKGQGVTSGVPDISVDVPAGGLHGLRIEMKRVGGKPSEEQLEQIAARRSMGYAAVICEGFDAARAATVQYLTRSWLVTDRWVG